MKQINCCAATQTQAVALLPRRMKTALGVLMASLLTACAWPPVLERAAAADSCQALKQPGAAGKPFYLIGHNPNTVESALDFLQRGANALEPDLRFEDGEIRVHDQFMAGPLRLRWPAADGSGPLLSDYLRGLRDGVGKTVPAPALIAFDLKPPFQAGWVRQAIETVREQYSRSWPQTAIVFTVGQADGLPVLAEVAPMLRPGEALGIDDGLDADAAAKALAATGKPHTFARAAQAQPLRVAAGLRDQGRSFSLVYAWTVNEPAVLQDLLSLGINGVIADAGAIGPLCGQLARAAAPGYRLATTADAPFGPAPSR